MNDTIMSNSSSKGEPTNSNNDEYLSNHTVSMRAALKHCQEILDSHPPPDAAEILRPHLYDTAVNAWRAAQSITAQREETLQQISEHPTIATLAYSENMPDFSKRFLHANRPCLIRGLDQSQHFEKVSLEWQSSDKTIHKEWFRTNLGNDTIVPVKQQLVRRRLAGRRRPRQRVLYHALDVERMVLHHRLTLVSQGLALAKVVGTRALSNATLLGSALVSR